jgi:CheY-like chemotaxis protein
MPKVMIVDDDRTTVRLLQTLLELDGFDISVSARGSDVLPMAQENRPDLFFMDYHLTDMEGIDILKALRAEGSPFAATPVVMTSGMDVEQAVMAAGADAFLIKPYEPDDLPELFNRLIEKR